MIENSARKVILRVFFYTVAFVFTACATKPVILSEEPSDPAGLLPLGEDYYILTRPAEHPELSREFLSLYMEGDSGFSSAVSRTDEGIFSGCFRRTPTASPPFSAVINGHYPVVILRSSLRRKEGWARAVRDVYSGPSGLLVDTAYKNSLLAASNAVRLNQLQDRMGQGARESVLPESVVQWWLEGEPALMAYLPEAALLPLPEGVPGVPKGSSMELYFLEMNGTGELRGNYGLDLRIVFPDRRSAKLWSLGVRAFLAARLGLSPSSEERAVLQNMDLTITENVFHLSGWVMSPAGWGNFLSSFRG